MGIYLFLSLGALLLLLLFETVDVEYVYDKKFMLRITFSVLEITLWNFKKNKRGKRRALTKSFSAFTNFKKALDYTVARSDITVNRVVGSVDKEDFSKNAPLFFGGYSLSISFVTAYLESRAKSIKTSQSSLSINKKAENVSAPFISVTQRLLLIHLLSGLLIIVFSNIKKLTKEGLKIGR